MLWLSLHDFLHYLICFQALTIAESRVFKHLPRDPANVYSLKQTCVMAILEHFTLFQPQSH